MVSPAPRFPTSSLAATVATTASVWQVTPSSLLGLPPGSLAALSVDSQLAASVLNAQAADSGDLSAALVDPDQDVDGDPDPYAELPPYMRD